MKKTFSILLVICMLCGILAACGSDNDEPETTQTPETTSAPVTIVGTWEYGSMDCAYIFKEDGTGAYRFSGADMPFTYTDDGTSLTIQYENATVPNVFKYTITDNVLYIEDSFGSIVEYKKK